MTIEFLADDLEFANLKIQNIEESVQKSIDLNSLFKDFNMLVKQNT